MRTEAAIFLWIMETKHIDICFHYTRDNVLRGTDKVQRIPSKDNAADGLIKLSRENFQRIHVPRQVSI
jgi:hypothetical protein